MMPHRSLALSQSPEPEPDAGASIRSVERAAARLRGGRPVLVRDGAPLSLVQAAETTSAEGFARLARLDGACLVLTAQRGRSLDLPINALYATPLVALVPVLVLWFGIYLKAKVIVVFLFAVFPILISTYQGVRECDKNMLEVAHSFRSNEWRTWQDVLLPFALPYVTAGVRLAIGRGLVGMVIAEFYTTITGLGFMITRYANNFEMDKTFVPVITLMILGVSLTAALKRLERRMAPWSHANR